MKPTLTFILAAWPALACTLVEGDRIVGADLAREHSSFQSIDAAADLGAAPVAGAQRILRTSDLEAIAARWEIALAEGAPKEACFERATETLTEARLLPVLAAELDMPGARIEILDFTRNALPLGTLEFARSGLSPKGLWRGSLLYGEHRSVPIWARVRITAPDGQTVAEWQTPAQPVVLRGDTVRVEVLSGGVRLAFDAPAESSGHSGEAVVVRNPANGQRFRAIVEAAGQVKIER